MAANESVLLTVALQGTFPFKVDYGADSASLVTSTRLSIADRPFELVRTEAKGQRLLARISPGLPVGPHELRVEFQDGRQVAFADGFQVTPALDITGLSIEFIQTQVRLRPFTIRIRVAGPDAELFKGPVDLEASRGRITPLVSSCSFSGGLCQQEVTLDDTSGANITITVKDSAGHQFTSNDFRLLPP
jgi:hypothetical protein